MPVVSFVENTLSSLGFPITGLLSYPSLPHYTRTQQYLTRYPFLRVLYVCWYFRYVRCYLTSFRINSPTLAHAAKLARPLSCGALGRPPPHVHAPRSGLAI
eukprot:765722-Pleurochrysis_carterae.AAC.1